MNEKLFAATKQTFGSGDTYPGYPTERFVGDEDIIDIPPGAWEHNNSPLPTAEEVARFTRLGLTLDSYGRPLHPWFKSMVHDPAIGVVAGKGFYWSWGPNYTADPVVIAGHEDRQVLLIQRGDTGKWALPGGFVDEGESDPMTAALRELREEANLTLTASGSSLYTGPVADLRSTAHAWAETAAYVWHIPETLDVVAGDDAKDARWFSEHDLPHELHGSHAALIAMALEREPNKSIRATLETPKEQLAITEIDAGHMAYDHLFIQDAYNHLFVKAHVAERFDDPFREAHSRAYLQKEFALYTHLSQHGYTAIPKRFDLIDDELLAMDALPTADNWQWKAPHNALDAYTKDVLVALESLEAVPLPATPLYQEAINDTYMTYWVEGWDALDTDRLEAARLKISELSSEWDDQRKAEAIALQQSLSHLRDGALAIERDQPLYFAHNDARQSNIAWHPEHGAKLVDWSWGDPGLHHADTTMFLIDLVKAGHDVSNYTRYINKDHALLLIGFWLEHSLWQTRDGSTTVREHQVASACAALSLLKQLQ